MFPDAWTFENAAWTCISSIVVTIFAARLGLKEYRKPHSKRNVKSWCGEFTVSWGMFRLACKPLSESHDAARLRVDNKARLYISLHRSGRPDGGSPFNRVSAAVCPEGAHLPEPPSHLYKLRCSFHSPDRPTGGPHEWRKRYKKRGTIFLGSNLCKNNVTWRLLKKEGWSLAALCGCVYSRERIVSRFLKLHYKYFPSQGLECVQFVDEVLMSSRQNNRQPGPLSGGFNS
jgi:hypothetical protein